MPSNEDLIKLVEKLKRTDSPTDAKAVLREIRKSVVCRKVPYEIIMADCLRTEDIKSVIDPMYDVFNQDVAKLLDGKDEDEQILLLTEMIILF